MALKKKKKRIKRKKENNKVITRNRRELPQPGKGNIQKKNLWLASYLMKYFTIPPKIGNRSRIGRK